MSLSLSDLNPVKALKNGFNSITGISAQEDAIKKRNKKQASGPCGGPRSFAKW